MNETESLLIANVLNGVPFPVAARAAGNDEGWALDVFEEAMKRVAEYVLVHCVAFFPCTSLPEARRHKARVLECLVAIERWDATERDIVLAIFKGRNVLNDGVPRAQAEEILNRTLNALPHYLTEKEIPAYITDRRAFVRERRSRVIEAVEKFVSFRNPLVYKKIEHSTVTMEQT